MILTFLIVSEMQKLKLFNDSKNKKYSQNAGIHFNNWRFAKHL